VSNLGRAHLGRKHRDGDGRVPETTTRLCLRCRQPFESEGAHHRLCYPCSRAVCDLIASDRPLYLSDLSRFPNRRVVQPGWKTL
jgi:hypothetical protein